MSADTEDLAALRIIEAIRVAFPEEATLTDATPARDGYECMYSAKVGIIGPALSVHLGLGLSLSDRSVIPPSCLTIWWDHLLP